MAQRATDLAKKRRATKVNRVGRVKKSDVIEQEPEMRAIPLDLAPLLAPYKKKGRLSIRIERLPPQSLLSRGRNNGDNSWSLASDEIEDLFYLIPEKKVDTHTLAIRLIGIDGGEGNTLAVLDLVVSPNAAPAPTKSGSKKGANPEASQPIQLYSDKKAASLRLELAKAKEELAAREAELEEVRTTLKNEMDEQLAQAAVQAAAELRETQNALKSQYESQIKEAESRAGNEIQEAREAWQRELQESRLKTEGDWKSEEAARLADVEAKLQKKFEAELAEANVRREKAEADLKTAQAKLEAEIVANSKSPGDPADASKQGDNELRRLRQDCEMLQASLTARESELEKLRSDADAACEAARLESRGMLLKAKEVWREEEAARLAEAEAQWRKKSAELQQEVEALRAKADQALQNAQDEAKAQIDAQTAASGDANAKLQALIGEREAEIARLRSEVNEGTALRDSTREEIGQLRNEHAKLKAIVAEREAELVQLRAQTRDGVSARNKASEEIEQLRDEQAKLRASLAEREAALEQSCAETNERAAAQEKATKELSRLQEERASLRANLSQREDELKRLSTELSERQAAQKKASAALHTLHDEHTKLRAAISQREKELAETRSNAKSSIAAQEKASNELGRLRDELSTLQTTLSEREAELTQLRSDAYLSTTERDKAARELERLRSEHESIQSRLSDRENELAQLRTEARDGASSLDKAGRELERLRRDHEKLRATLSQRESELEQSRAKARDGASELSKGEKELRRLRNECSKLQASAEKREKKLAQMRVVADDAVATRSEENKALRKLRKEYSKLESVIATRDAQIAQLRAAAENPASAPALGLPDAQSSLDEKPVAITDQPEIEPEEIKPKIKLVEEDNYDEEDEMVPDVGIVLRTNKSWSEEKASEKKGRKSKKGNFSRDTIVAAALAASVVIFYPIVMQYLPPSMQLSGDNQPIEAAEQQLAEEPVQNLATTIGAVNFRAGPSTAADVLATLQAGMQVVVVEESGNWTLIRVEGEGDEAEPQEGWVSSTFLENVPPAEVVVDDGTVAAINQTGQE